MPAAPLPTPLPKWAKWLVQALPFIAAGLQNAIDFIGELHTSNAAVPSQWRRIQVVFDDTTSLNPRDIAVCTFDVVNITNGAVDNTWTQADYDQVDANLTGLVNAWLQNAQGRLQHTQTRYYVAQFTDLPTAPIPPGQHDKPFVKAGPPEHTTYHTGVGNVANAPMPSQVAVTHTERTPYAKHWGRTYWPLPSGAMITSNGHILQSECTRLANAVWTCYDLWQTNEFYPVVPVTQISGSPARGLLGVDRVQVDDVFDVIRRRRAATTGFRAYAPTPPGLQLLPAPEE